MTAVYVALAVALYLLLGLALLRGLARECKAGYSQLFGLPHLLVWPTIFFAATVLVVMDWLKVPPPEDW